MLRIHSAEKYTEKSMTTSTNDDISPRPGSGYGRINTYTPIKQLGRGAFGEATLYLKTDNKELVVWKKIELTFLSNKQKHNSMEEIDILSLLQHVNIVAYLNHYMDSNSLFIEMEYADGLTLHQQIDKPLSEYQSTWYFYQLIRALAYIHEHGVIHRDVKPANCFLTKNDILKLGDFGISRFHKNVDESFIEMEGTPSYMAPELMKGMPYDFKGDCWSAGCILYEMITGKRLFSLTNALQCAQSICSFIPEEHFESEEIKGKRLKKVLYSSINSNIEKRESSTTLLNCRLFQKYSDSMERKLRESFLASSHRELMLNQRGTSNRSRTSTPTIENKECSLVPIVHGMETDLFVWGGGKYLPQKIEFFTNRKYKCNVCRMSNSHCVVLTVEKEIYSWINSNNQKELQGELGHSNTCRYKQPKKIEELNDMNIIDVACGDGFTICLDDEGNIFSFGSDEHFCLGINCEGGDKLLEPTINRFLKGIPIKQVVSGDHHVLVLTAKDSIVYSWGCGEFGKLGHGDEMESTTPTIIKMTQQINIRSIAAGKNCSFFLTDEGRVFAFGNNECNKLGLNSKTIMIPHINNGNKDDEINCDQFNLSFDVPMQTTPKLVTCLKQFNIVAISSGNLHTACINDQGQVIIFGSNFYGQLGSADTKPRDGIHVMEGILSDIVVTKIACGDYFTICISDQNKIFGWGLNTNGRLGQENMNGNKICTPKEIFLVTNRVTEIYTSGWSVMLLCERTMNGKTIISTLSVNDVMNDDCVASLDNLTFSDGNTNAKEIYKMELEMANNQNDMARERNDDNEE